VHDSQIEALIARIILEYIDHAHSWSYAQSVTARSGKPECSLDERLKELAAGK
jgi:hypothetical protein